MRVAPFSSADDALRIQNKLHRHRYEKEGEDTVLEIKFHAYIQTYSDQKGSGSTRKSVEMNVKDC